MPAKWVLSNSFHEGQQVLIAKTLFMQNFHYIAGLPLKKRIFKTFVKGTECVVLSTELWQFAVRLYTLKVLDTGEVLQSVPEEALEEK